LRIERFAVERHLERMLDKPVTTPIRFRAAMDLRTPAAASWAQAVQLLVGDLGRPAGLADVTGGRNPWTSFLIDGLLLAQAHNYSDRLAEPRHGPSRPAPVKRAIDLIESEPESELSVDRLAAAAGVSARSLQRHFRTHVGMSPREYVQQVRLTRVRDELTAAQPGDGLTVADVALRWGFGHVPRFAGLYRKRFGESPSQTLRG
jgi:AraC-like DNA-binding protein